MYRGGKLTFAWRILLSLILTFLYFAPLFSGNFTLFVIAVLLINTVWASATWGLFHQAGQSLFAVAVIAGAGGYFSALLQNVFPNSWFAMAIALFLCCGIGIFCYLLMKRVPGHIQFAVLNLALIFVFGYLLIAFTNVTGGIDGIELNYFYPDSFFGNISARYLVVLTLCLLSLFVIHRIMISRFGKIITLIGRNPSLAASVGIDTDKYLMKAYLIFTPLMGLGGILYSHFIGHISPETWNADLSLMIVFCTLIGGSSTIIGPTIGAIIATGIPILFDVSAEFRFAIVGVIAILIFVFMPEGLTDGIKRMILNKFESKVSSSSDDLI